jgi:hypothetical protein
MSDNKPRAFTKKYGTRKEVFDGVACMTRGSLSIEDLFLDNDGVIRSLRQQESLKKSQDNLVRKEKKVNPDNNNNSRVVGKGKVVPSDDDDSEVENNSDPGPDVTRTKAVPTKALNISDIKEVVTAALQKNNSKLPKGHSKWKKQQWVEKARELQLVQ